MSKKLGFKISLMILSVLFTSRQLFACTIFHTKGKNGEIFVGRNFDCEKENIKIWFIPANGEKNGIVVFEQLGVDMPYEGINDKGLFIGIAAVPNTKTPFSLFKPMRKSLEIVKIILEEAQTVDEALKIFEKYTVIFGVFLGNPVVHYMIVDKQGNSAVVEYVNKKIKILKNNKSKVMTNHFVSHPEIIPESKTSFERYDIVMAALTRKDKFSIENIQELLQTVSQKHTLYSNVYDLTNQKIYLTYKNLEIKSFSLKDELYEGAHGYIIKDLNENETLEYQKLKMPIVFRPYSGHGYSIEDKNVFHYGCRILLAASKIKKYGLEITRFNNKDKYFTSIGIVLEQRLWEWFNMSIGTIGYFDYGKNSNNVVGLVTNLGWEPNNSIPFKPFVTYRTDITFSSRMDIVSSLSIGFNFEFGSVK